MAGNRLPTRWNEFHLSFFQIRIKLENQLSVSDELVKLKDYFELCKNHLDIPFEKLKVICRGTISG